MHNRITVPYFPGIPYSEDVLTTLHFVHGAEQILVPEDLVKNDLSLRDKNLKNDFPFLKIIKNKTDEFCEKESVTLLNSLGLRESICSRYPDLHYENLKAFFSCWLLAVNSKSQLCLLTTDRLFEAINIIAYEYSGILNPTISKETVAWIYSNVASNKSNVSFFEAKYRNKELLKYLEREYKPEIIKCRNQLVKHQENKGLIKTTNQISND